MLVAMLPEALLLEAIHSKTLTCSERDDALLFGSCVMPLYGLTTDYATKIRTDHYVQHRNLHLKAICYNVD